MIGLYTAYKLLEKHVPGSDVLVVAEYMPGDESINYTSPYAGGNFSCITGDDAETLVFDKHTYTNLAALQAKLGGPKCGLDVTPSTEYWSFVPAAAKITSLKSYLKDFHEIPLADLLEGAQYGITFTTWNFNCPKFLASLQKYLMLQNVQFARQKLTHISQAFEPGASTVFNCTGIGAKRLGGVDDTAVYPTRGQVVVVKAPHITENVMFWGKDFATYIIKRPWSHDQLILGGFMQKDDWTPDVLQSQTADILARTTKLCPKILKANPHGEAVSDLEVLRVVAGLRPSRHGGVRIEKQSLYDGKSVIHNYGAAGYGYQAGLGMADKAVNLALSASKL